MKALFQKSATAAAIAASLALTACVDSTNFPVVDDDPVIDVTPPAIEDITVTSTLNLTFKDADTGDLITAPLTVTVTQTDEQGDDIATLKFFDGSAVGNSFAVNDGFISLTVTNDYAANAAISLKFLASGDGFFAGTVAESSLSSEIQTQALDFNLKSEVSDNSDVAVATAGGSLADAGGADEDIAIESDSGATVSIDTTALASGTITILDDSGQEDDTAKLVIKSEVTETSGTGGSTTEEQVGGAEIALETGTQLLKEDGTPLTGTPSIKIASFSNEATTDVTAAATQDDLNTNALALFPGGLSADNVITGEETSGGTTETTTASGEFVSGGFVAVEITNEAGEKVKNFSKPIEVKFTLSKDTINPCPAQHTGELDQTDIIASVVGKFDKGVSQDGNGGCGTPAEVVENDVIPVWSYDTATAQWSFESYGVAKEQDPVSDLLDVVVEVDHLSYWNLDWFGNRCETSDPDNKVEFNVEDSTGVSNLQPFDFFAQRDGGGWSRKKTSNKWGSYGTADIFRAPDFAVNLNLLVNGTNVIDYVKDASGNVVFGNDDGNAEVIDIPSICALHDNTVVFTTPNTQTNLVNQDVILQAACDETDAPDGAVIPPAVPLSGLVFAWDGQGDVGFDYSQDDGTLQMSLISGNTYQFWTYNFSNGERNIVSQQASADNPVTLTTLVDCEFEVPNTGATGGTN